VEILGVAVRQQEEEQAVLDGNCGHATALPTILTGVLRRVPTAPVVTVVAAQWPSWLVTLDALGIPVEEAYFPTAYHSYFKPKNRVHKWKTPLDLFASTVHSKVIYLLSGSVEFLRKMQAWFGAPGSQRLIVVLEIHRRGSARKAIRAARNAGSQLLREMNLRVVSFLDKDCGGATDAFHDVGFVYDIGSPVVPTPEVGLPLTVRHFLDGGADITASMP